MDIFDDTVAEKPDGDVLTMEKLKEAVERLRSGGCLPSGTVATWSSPWHAEPLFGLRTFVSDYLPAEVPRKLTRWERFRVWVEDLADRADCCYHFPRVQRTEPAKAILIGRDLYIPRAAASSMRINS